MVRIWLHWQIAHRGDGSRHSQRYSQYTHSTSVGPPLSHRLRCVSSTLHCSLSLCLYVSTRQKYAILRGCAGLWTALHRKFSIPKLVAHWSFIMGSCTLWGGTIATWRGRPICRHTMPEFSCKRSRQYQSSSRGSGSDWTNDHKNSRFCPQTQFISEE